MDGGFIDVVIPTCAKDLGTLELVIERAKRFVVGVRNVYVVSAQRYTQNARFIPESAYPFAKADVERLIPTHRAGWYYQQLLKLYAFEVAPELSDDVLILDSETIFYKPVRFVDDAGRALYATSDEVHPPYYRHMARLVQGLGQALPGRSGIVHHMLMRRGVVRELREHFDWSFFLAAVDPADYSMSGASEYEIYLCYAFAHHPDTVAVRELRWDLSSRVLLESDFDFLTAHAHLRKE